MILYSNKEVDAFNSFWNRRRKFLIGTTNSVPDWMDNHRNYIDEDRKSYLPRIFHISILSIANVYRQQLPLSIRWNVRLFCCTEPNNTKYKNTIDAANCFFSAALTQSAERTIYMESWNYYRELDFGSYHEMSSTEISFLAFLRQAIIGPQSNLMISVDVKLERDYLKSAYSFSPWKDSKYFCRGTDLQAVNSIPQIPASRKRTQNAPFDLVIYYKQHKGISFINLNKGYFFHVPLLLLYQFAYQ